jgi:hypothetical protein
MSADFQTIAALVVVAATAAWFVIRAVVKRRKPGCNEGCCGATNLRQRRPRP